MESRILSVFFVWISLIVRLLCRLLTGSAAFRTDSADVAGKIVTAELAVTGRVALRSAIAHPQDGRRRGDDQKGQPQGKIATTPVSRSRPYAWPEKTGFLPPKYARKVWCFGDDPPQQAIVPIRPSDRPPDQLHLDPMRRVGNQMIPYTQERNTHYPYNHDQDAQSHPGPLEDSPRSGWLPHRSHCTPIQPIMHHTSASSHRGSDARCQVMSPSVKIGSARTRTGNREIMSPLL